MVERRSSRRGPVVGIIRRPLRAPVLPDRGGRSAMVVPTATVIHGAGNELLAAALAWLNPRFLSEFYPTGTSRFKCALNPGVACELADRGGFLFPAPQQATLPLPVFINTKSI